MPGCKKVCARLTVVKTVRLVQGTRKDCFKVFGNAIVREIRKPLGPGSALFSVEGLALGPGVYQLYRSKRVDQQKNGLEAGTVLLVSGIPIVEFNRQDAIPEVQITLCDDAGEPIDDPNEPSFVEGWETPAAEIPRKPADIDFTEADFVATPPTQLTHPCAYAVCANRVPKKGENCTECRDALRKKTL